MEFSQVLRKRSMTRAFSAKPVPEELIEALLADALLAPSAGNTAAVEFLVLQGSEQVQTYWDLTLTDDKRANFRWQKLLDAPALVLVTTRPDAYPERYAEEDKRRDSLSAATSQWPVPFWWVDAGCVVQNLLLAATNAGLGACLFGLFNHEEKVCAAFGVPPDVRVVGAIAIGHRLQDEPGRSATRHRRSLAEVLHRQHW